MRVVIAALTVALASVVSSASPALAQDGRVQLSASVGGAFGAGDSSAAFDAAGGIQLGRYTGIQAEFVYVPNQRLQSGGDFVPQLFPAPPSSATTTRGRTIAVLGSFVASAPLGRLRPYAQIGGGVANVEQRIRAAVSGPIVSTADAASLQTTILSTSENAPAVSTGGGLEVRVWRRVAVAAELRYMRLFRTESRAGGNDLTRFGARLGYWF